jgi:predicted MFS family arabinose efflux permease
VSVYLALLRQRSFRLLWLGDTASTLGDVVGFLALVWLVYTTAGSVRSLGIFVAVYTAPVLVGGPIAGAALDRFDKRKLLLADNLVRGALVALIPVLHVIGALEVWHLYAFAAVYGLLKMIPLAGVPSMIPDLVDESDLAGANGLESISFFISSIAGAAIGGALIAAVGGATALWIDALSYFAFAFALWRIGPVWAHASHARDHASRSYAIRDALRFIVRSRVILATTLMFMAVNVAVGMIDVIGPVYVKEILDRGAGTYGAIVAVASGAGLAGAVYAGASSRADLGRSIAVCEIAAGLVYSLLAAKLTLILAFLVFAVASLFLGPLTVWAQTIRMRVIPADLRGRIFGLLRTAMQATPPLGALLAAPLLALGGMRTVAAVLAALLVIPAVTALAVGALSEPAIALASPSEA